MWLLLYSPFSLLLGGLLVSVLSFRRLLGYRGAYYALGSW